MHAFVKAKSRDKCGRIMARLWQATNQNWLDPIRPPSSGFHKGHFANLAMRAWFSVFIMVVEPVKTAY